MRKLLFLLFILPFLNSELKASHIAGGEVYWKCLSNGKYVFYTTIYVDCTGIGYLYQDVFLKIVGNPLPRNQNNQPIERIILKPDSNRWNSTNKGDYSYDCIVGDSLNRFSCSSKDRGMMQAFYMKSGEITLNGTPPTNGWEFQFIPPCCSPNYANVISSTIIFHSTMYKNGDSLNNNTCLNNPPEFIQKYKYLFLFSDSLRNMTLNISDMFTASSPDADSLTFHWDRAYEIRQGNNTPVPVSYKPGYKYDNPFGGESINPANVDAVLDQKTGQITFARFANYSYDNFLVVVRADAWKDGEIYASISRETPVALMNGSGLNNNGAVFYFDNNASNRYEVNVTAGTKVNLSIEVRDSSVTTGKLENLWFHTYDSEILSADRNDTSACDNPPCAVYQNSTPVYDSAFQEYMLIDSLIQTGFEWQTECAHLEGNKTKTYYFHMKATDNLCPLPGENGAYIKVNIHSIGFRGIESINKSLQTKDTFETYQWIDCDNNTLISGANSRVFTPTETGNYAVVVSNGSCVDTSECFNFSLTSLANRELKNNVQIYPNPTTDKITIAVDGEYKINSVRVFNIQGQLIEEKQIHIRDQYDFRINAKAGVYFIELTDNNGQKANYKLIKH